MTPKQYRAALAASDLSQEGAADLLGIGRRTSQGYALGETKIPGPIAILARLLEVGRITADDIEATKRGARVERGGKKRETQ